MRYRICKSFEIESGHMLSKHPGRCRLPHGHTRRIDLVLSSETLDAHDMVCDFKALKLALTEFIDAFDHATAINSDDPALDHIRAAGGGGGENQRVVVFESEDPTTEVLARRIFEFVAGELAQGGSYADDEANAFAFRTGLSVERVRVSETSTSWAEYGI